MVRGLQKNVEHQTTIHDHNSVQCAHCLEYKRDSTELGHAEHGNKREGTLMPTILPQRLPKRDLPGVEIQHISRYGDTRTPHNKAPLPLLRQQRKVENGDKRSGRRNDVQTEPALTATSYLKPVAKGGQGCHPPNQRNSGVTSTSPIIEANPTASKKTSVVAYPQPPSASPAMGKLARQPGERVPAPGMDGTPGSTPPSPSLPL